MRRIIELAVLSLSALWAAEGLAQAPTCDGRLLTMPAGTDGDDAIVGTPGDDVIFGGGGADQIDGGGGNDFICGGDGNDVLAGSDGDDTLIGGDGDDALSGGAGDDVHQSGAGVDSCDGGAGIDSADRDCEAPSGMDVEVVFLTLRAADGTPLAGELYVPTGGQAASGTRRVAMLHRHGALGSYAVGVPRLAGLYGAIRGFTVLALNRRDWGPDAGGGNTLFEDATRDLGVGMDFLEQLGFDQVFIGGHSQGTTNAGVYPGYVPDSRLVGVGLYGTISDARISAENVVFAGFYDAHVALAGQLVSQGETEANTVIGWDTAFGQQVFRSPRSWLSYYGPDTLAVPVREITGSPVPVLLLRAQGDLFTLHQWSVAVRDAAAAAGVDATYTVLPYPDTVFDPAFFGGNAHSFVGIERELIATTLDWLRARVPDTDQFTTGIAFPQAIAGNYPPYARAGADVVSGAASAGLDGSASYDIDDPAGAVAGYQWTQIDGPAVDIDDSASTTPTVTATGYGAQIATFMLTVTDADGATASDTVQVTLDGGEAPASPDDDGLRSSGNGSSLDGWALAALAAAAARRRRRYTARPPPPYT